MSRKDRFILQFIVWLAVATFLFGIWSIVMGLRKTSPPSSKALPNGPSAIGATN